jgi:hypothetical protein
MKHLNLIINYLVFLFIHIILPIFNQIIKENIFNSYNIKIDKIE